MKSRILIILSLTFVVLFAYQLLNDKKPKSILTGKTITQVTIPEKGKINQALDTAESWTSIETRTNKLNSIDEINDRIQSIDAFIAAKGLVKKMNDQFANNREFTLFTELTRERAMLFHRKINLDLNRIEKEIL